MWRAFLILVTISLTGCLTRRAADVMTVPRRVLEAGHWEKETATKPVRFDVVAADGVVISALELPADPAVPKLGTAYLFHGFGNTKEQMLPVAKRLTAAGFRCVAWDSRGHGKSGGERASYGMREVDDALRVIKASRKRDQRPQGKDVFWGYSMGAAVALQTLPRDSRAEAAVLLAPFADLSQIMRHHARQIYSGAMVPFLPWVRSDVRSAAGFDPKRIKPIESVHRTDARLLFIHGGRDGVIPPDQSAQLLSACAEGQGRRLLLPDLGHGDVMWSLPEPAYRTAVDFLMTKD
ncbi:lysophospholipase [Luteolibacter flavescens]|uniref:Lysophospholipase n=1 Tax=Luteolibacter flavescens TaxID=1859460 RepID=A0ABT3FHW9_9BACT|nr:lysophospholipase [Luteolibacter flavescens]MCW1883168.1 lysophospholipase [Luteolibacter flavescens]